MIKKYFYILFVSLISVLFLSLSFPGEALEVKFSVDGRYVDNGDDTIKDTKTGLMWTKKDSYADTGSCINWNDAKSYVSGLSTGGHTDWRLPTGEELMGIYEVSKNRMAFDNDSLTPLHLDAIFADGAAYYYWSSETADDCCARYLVFLNGAFLKYTRELCSLTTVRAVRR